MDYKARLQEIVSGIKAENEAEEHRRRSFEGQQRAAFAKVRQPLNEILEAAGSVVSERYENDSRAYLAIIGPGNKKTNYDFEPNSIGKYSSSPAPAPGFEISIETLHEPKHDYVQPEKREYVLKDAEELFEDLMKYIAESIATK